MLKVFMKKFFLITFESIILIFYVYLNILVHINPHSINISDEKAMPYL